MNYLVGSEQLKISQGYEFTKKDLRVPFDEYAASQIDEGKVAASQLLDRIDYATVVANSQKPISADNYASNPKFYYLNSCDKSADLAIPLL